MSPSPTQLAQLAEQAGIDVHWQDANGHAREVSEPILRAVLDHLGLPCASNDDVEASLRQVQEEREGRTLPRLITAETGQSFVVPAATSARTWRLENEEQQSLREGQLGAGDRQLTAPRDPGYYRLLLDDQLTTLAVAPTQAFSVADLRLPRRPWGVAVQLGSLRRSGDAGIGDFTALEHAIHAAARNGADAMAISPVHALFAAQPERYGPYAPSSRLFLNALHVDPARAADAAMLRKVIDAHNLRQEWAELEWLDLIDWPRAARARMTVLRSLFEQASVDPTVSRRFNAFRKARGEPLERHARFESLQRHFTAHDHPGGWQAWPEAFHDPAGAEVANFAREHSGEVAFHAFLQWLADQGLAHAQQTARESGMSIGLITDLAVGTDGGGSQAWSHQGELLHGLSVGAPPDALNRIGQDWGLTTFSPRGLRQSGFAGFIGMLRAALAHAGGVRIDHVLGLKRLWLVPHGARPTEGAYVRYPFTDLLRLLKLESHLHAAVLIGEDLGTVPADIRHGMAGAGLLGIRVLWFERAADRGFISPSHWSDHAIATTSTHDVATVAGWWGGRDIEWRQRTGLNDPDSDEVAERAVDRDLLWRAMCASGAASDERHPPAPDEVTPVVVAAAGHVARAPAPLVVVPVEDLLALPEQPNLPGPTDAEHPNWRRRLPDNAAHMFDGDVAQACFHAITTARNGS